jgi:adenine-specific DNA-methyltransferase
MNPLTAEEVRSSDICAQNIERLKELFPEAIVEGRIDFSVLRQLLGDAVDEEDEKFGLSWHGKRDSRRLALTPSAGTLRPCPEASVDWDTTQHLAIEGDNLEVLKLLQKSYAGRVKVIYIDPPYNTGKDLLYPNDFEDAIRTYLEVTGQAEGGARLSTNADTGGRFHTNWLNMMYPRLLLARQLLRRDGVLICTIDENEQSTLGMLLKEVFNEGSYDHVCVTVVHNPRGIQGANFSYTHEYAFFVFPRGIKAIGNREIEEKDIQWRSLRDNGGESLRTNAKNCFYPILIEDGEIVGFGDVLDNAEHPARFEREGAATLVYPIDNNGVERKWRYARQSVESIAHLLRARPVKDGYEIQIGKNFGLYRTVWADKRYDANEHGTKVLNALLPDSPFTFPKSLWTVYDSLYAVVGDDKEAIVMDFFAGSGTTGHATLELNRRDGGNRRYVLVQLPEPIQDNPTYSSIYDVMAARLRSAAASIREAAPMFAGDTGFRAFRLDSTNIRAWDPNPEDVDQALLDAVEHLKPGRTEADLLYELLLKLGIDLCVPIETQTIAGKDVSSVGGGVLIACLTERIDRGDSEELALGIAEWQKQLGPAGDTTCVFRDSAFSDDVVKTNLAAVLEQHGIATVRSI